MKAYNNQTRLNLNLTIALSRSVQRIRRKEQTEIAQHGLTLSQFAVLEALYHKGPLRIQDLLTKTLSTGGNMTVVIRNLIRSGYITKRKDEIDRRASIVELTDNGERLISSIFPDHRRTIDSLFETLNTEEKEQMLQLLKKLNQYNESNHS